MTASQPARELSPTGEFVRQPNHFTDRVERPVPGRYVLYASLACPWAHRCVIVRSLLGLEDSLRLRVVDPLRDQRGWRFTLDEGDVDPVTGARHVMDLYRASDPSFTGRATVPFLYDTSSDRIVTNDYPQITLDLETVWKPLHANGAPDLYPQHLRGEIDAMAEANFHAVNNGVYKAGFATTQQAYESAYDALFARLDELEQRLATRRYLVGDQLTEADVRLYPTLARFDSVYHGHFKANRHKLVELPNLWAYARDLWQTPGFGDTTDQGHIKAHYYRTHDTINPTGIIPKGPGTDWSSPHGREALGGQPPGSGRSGAR
jgi:putative glutathione S-transferase